MKKKSANKPSLSAVIINALDDLKAQNVVTMDVTQLTDVTDTLIIASGSSNRQVRALAQHAVEEAKKKGMPCMGIEGLDDGEWVLADFGDVVLHVMQPEVREFYDLEKLWQAPDTKAELPKKSVAPKTLAEKSSKTKPATGKAPAAAAEYMTQSDAAKARKAPKKPKAPVVPASKALPGSKKPAAAKAAPPKAGVLAKTGTRKTTASKSATATKPAKKTGSKKTATPVVTAKKPAARKPRTD